MLSKQVAGEQAANFIQDDMLVGLGTGSTVYYTLLAIGKRIKEEGLRIQGMPTSQNTEQLAQELGIPLIGFRDTQQLDMTIDGADEINPDLALIKGGGGALYREKMVASISEKLLIIAHQTKYVDQLGKFPLPVEVVPFGYEITQARIRALGCTSVLRSTKMGKYKTDNGNYILDCEFGTIPDPAVLNQQLKSMTGVVETGLFIGMTNLVLIGKDDGTHEQIGSW